MKRTANRLALALAVALTLAFPAGVFAASSNSDTAESLTVDSTISMTAPATATYVAFSAANSPIIGSSYSYDATITVISSNNPSGLTVTATVEPWTTAGGINVPTTKRWTGLTNQSGGSGASLDVAAGNLPIGSFATSSTVKTLASATGPLAGRSFIASFAVNQSEFLVGGVYTSAAHYTATTNP
jgi:hypothetical protein